MADQQGLDPTVSGIESTSAQSGPASTVAEGKGKEKQPIQDVSMGEEESDDDEDESGVEGPVCNLIPTEEISSCPLISSIGGPRAYVPTSIGLRHGILTMSRCRS